MDGPYRCQNANDGTNKGPNDALATAIANLGELYRGAPGGNEFRVRGYTKAASIIRNHPLPITSREQALSLKGIGESVADRVSHSQKNDGLLLTPCPLGRRVPPRWHHQTRGVRRHGSSSNHQHICQGVWHRQKSRHGPLARWRSIA